MDQFLYWTAFSLGVMVGAAAVSALFLKGNGNK